MKYICLDKSSGFTVVRLSSTDKKTQNGRDINVHGMNSGHYCYRNLNYKKKHCKKMSSYTVGYCI